LPQNFATESSLTLNETAGQPQYSSRLRFRGIIHNPIQFLKSLSYATDVLKVANGLDAQVTEW